ncbi:hypothetical protein KDX31_16485 [Amphritea atlantica]|uniref:Replication initiation protein RepC n=1 Tax=Amphritea atlantica TaxID=355243 RepID=A0ABY5GSI1_9GAMM|nr:hypothetical protein KDX31_16485 [Amphritea atlantica]
MSFNRGLSTASRFVWIGLNHLAYEQNNTCIEGSVKSIGNRLGLCDRTFKKAIEELRKARLLTLINMKTNLGANSFKYDLTPILNASCNEELSHPSFRNLLLSQKPFAGKKITVRQRMLMIAVLAISEEFGFVTDLHKVKLSKLTGIPRHNISPNLFKLEAKGLISPIIQSNSKKSIWAHQPELSAGSSGIKLLFSSYQYLETKVISLFTRNKELEKQLSTLDPLKLGKKPMNYPNMRWADIDRHLSNPFHTAPDMARQSLLEAITLESGRTVWKRLEKKNLLFDLNLVLLQAAVQILLSTDSSGMYNESAQTNDMIQQQLQFFPITPKQRETLIQIAVLLSAMIATAIKNQIKHIFPKWRLTGSHIWIVSLHPILTLHCYGANESGMSKNYIFNYEPNYNDRNETSRSGT